MVKPTALVSVVVVLLVATLGMLRSSTSARPPASKPPRPSWPRRAEWRAGTLDRVERRIGRRSVRGACRRRRSCGRRTDRRACRLQGRRSRSRGSRGSARLQETAAIRQRLLRGGREDARAESEAQVRSAEARFSNARLAYNEHHDCSATTRSSRGRPWTPPSGRTGRGVNLEAARQHATLIRAEPLAEERGQPTRPSLRPTG